MARRVSLSGENVSIAQAALHHNDTDSALRLFFSPASPAYDVRFAGYKPVEVRDELQDRLDELDRQTTLSLLAAVEAAFRVDYLHRCHRKGRDGISRRFRDLYERQGSKVSFEDDILAVWKDCAAGSASLVAELRGAFRFRHWMAHGRYWRPKLGRRYDYPSVYPLALQAVNSFPLTAP